MDNKEVSVHFDLYCFHIYFISHTTVLRLIPKLGDSNLYPSNLELLRVHLAATIFSDDVQNLLRRYKDDVSQALNIVDLDPLLMYLSHFWELLQLNNSVSTCLCYIHHH